jgi:hypothetical protein
MNRTKQPFDHPNDEASSRSKPIEGLTTAENKAVRTAEAIAQGTNAGGPTAADVHGGGSGAPPPPAIPPGLTNVGRLMAKAVDNALLRVFGPPGPLPPEDQAEAERLWSELLVEFGIILPTLGPGGQLLLLYGTHIGMLYAIAWLTEPERPLSSDNPDAARPHS